MDELDDETLHALYISMHHQVENTKLRIPASKVAALIGLHEYGNPVEDFLEMLYQGLDDLLHLDASVLHMEVTTKDAELDALIRKSGADAALNTVLKWTADTRTTANVNDAMSLSHKVQNHVDKARKKHKLTKEEGQKLQEALASKLRQSVGKRNESLAIQLYENQHGVEIHSTNDKLYFLYFPHPGQVKALTCPSPCPCDKAKALENFIERADKTSLHPRTGQHFSVCGMVDGVADVLRIDDADDSWTTERIVVEVKNRMGRFRDPVPLHDVIQMAVYMKMLGVRQGDMVQCIHQAETRIHVTRVSLDAYPLTSTAVLDCTCSTDLWVSLVVPRLYTYADVIYAFRLDSSRRRAFLQASPTDQMRLLRADLPFL
ncbi:hypothetical protein H310_11505 [Aphanomyces invadans]|uniref:Uncharacterized protein n=1 Tax=Aphanomyces invadans TaxID=157072 RepID=A0A024TLG6_9STRA|nr:hypothetical protein H310_11505 [Aphanomyces invadans]ETV94839.1 hypothetical protein H310_11505 [Aphanomyces invadans]|eukprot:XP_008876430.1 hypothetical protein H310_11505 [Aphanomyces invadans]